MNFDWQCVVDAGNSRIKVGWFLDGILKEIEVLEHAQWQAYQPKHKAQKALIASVSLPEEMLASPLEKAGINDVHIWRSHNPLPFSSDYTSPETMGSDRKMMVLGANSLFPGINRLVIGMGTCITYDLINSQGHHLGGDISPGIFMRWQAMHHFTARLPLVSYPDTWPELGTNTQMALQSGVLQGVLAEMKGRKQQFELILSDLTIILSGGDAHFFEKRFDTRIFAEPNLALYGLHALL